MRYYILALLAAATIVAGQRGGIDDFLKNFTTPAAVVYTTALPTTLSRSLVPGGPVASDCTTDAGTPGYCVRTKACRDGRISTNGSGVIKQRASTECAATDVCCELSGVTTATAAPSTIPGTAGHCGTVKKHGIIRAGTTNGVTVANFGEYPWTVPIFEIEDGVENYLAGGSLIHPRLVLTSAAQFVRGGNFVVKAGDWDITANYETFGAQISNVAEAITHKGFNSGSLTNNIALLLLATAITANPYNVGYACLPTVSTNTAVGTRCFATGWGQDTNGVASKQPKKMKLPIVDKLNCQATLRSVANSNLEIGNADMCAGGEVGVDTCRGDGGSPLMCPYPGTKDQVYVAGIVSWGLGCGEAGVPAVYSDVAALRPWIDQQMAAKGLGSSYFTP